MNFERRYGALPLNYLEHFDPVELIEKLEDWEVCLRADPKMTQYLRSLEQADSEDSSAIKPTTPSVPKPRGPRP